MWIRVVSNQVQTRTRSDLKHFNRSVLIAKQHILNHQASSSPLYSPFLRTSYAFSRQFSSDSDTGLSKEKKKDEDVMPIATGHEREELEAELESVWSYFVAEFSKEIHYLGECHEMMTEEQREIQKETFPYLYRYATNIGCLHSNMIACLASSLQQVLFVFLHWTLTRGANTHKGVEWEEKFWEAADQKWAARTQSLSIQYLSVMYGCFHFATLDVLIHENDSTKDNVGFKKSEETWSVVSCLGSNITGKVKEQGTVPRISRPRTWQMYGRKGHRVMRGQVDGWDESWKKYKEKEMGKEKRGEKPLRRGSRLKRERRKKRVTHSLYILPSHRCCNKMRLSSF
ncbi:hypothetical protein IFM89_014831 [Coptis chinensis]|uniref:Uncharacterized protein n=1 Tax=Coptis chinensis TaxID=261450 RepID=A0A835IAS5_9MAGN|nr:hypothetical protein IFM89_014831 [Coptis chinensis]